MRNWVLNTGQIMRNETTLMVSCVFILSLSIIAKARTAELYVAGAT